MKISSGRIRGFAARPDATVVALLLHGPDALEIDDLRVRLSSTLLKAAGEGAEITAMDPGEARRDPAALRDALRSGGLFGGRPVVVIEGAADGATDAVSSAIEGLQPGEGALLVTAGQLNARSKLRKLFEDSGNCASLAIYPQVLDRDGLSAMLSEAGLEPSHVLEDGLDLEATVHFEKLRDFTQWPREKQLYGYGGTIVARPATNPLTRDRVSAVFKLTQTGGQPRMKFGNERGLGKQSVPGQPVVWRRLRGDGPLGIIGQADETPPEDYAVLSGNPDLVETLRLCNAHELPRMLESEGLSATAGRSPQTLSLIETVSNARVGGRR